MIVRRLTSKQTAPGCGGHRRPRLRAEDGFTLVEALVATLVLTAGLLAAYMMLTISTHSASDVKAREGAVTLARQITDDARSIPYASITSSTLTSTLQAFPGLSNGGSGSTWTIQRNGVTYTVTASVTNANDPKDTSGATDLKQIGVAISWTTFQGKTHQFSETTTLTKAGQDPGLIASGLQLAAAQQGIAGIQGTSTAPVVTSTAITSLQFQVTAPTGTTAIQWSLNGANQSTWNGSTPSSGNTWTSSSWSLSGVSDGTYTVGAQAVDSDGVAGPSTTITVRLIRNVPAAPNVTNYGYNNQLPGYSGTVAELQWTANSELNVVGYRVYNPNNVAICQTSTSSFTSNCSTNGGNAWCSSPTACIDLSPPSNGSNKYTVKALYYDANNTLQEGTGTTVTLSGGTPSPPLQIALVSLTAVTQPDNTAIITWTPTVGGTGVSFYRIYRDGSSYTNRYDVLQASSCSTTCTYHDTNRSSSHNYWITAVSSTMAESQPTGPVSG
jgi:Tfp pilus assembly protein PilV